MELKEVNFKVVECKNILINHKREIIFANFDINIIKRIFYMMMVITKKVRHLWIPNFQSISDKTLYIRI